MLKNILKNKLTFLLILTSLTMSACQTQDNNPSDVTDTTPPSGVHYSTPDALYTTGVEIVNTPIVPDSVVVTHYSITPALPAYLSFDEKTGVISGTSTSTLRKTAYLITASNDFGETKTVIIITIANFPPAGLAYASPDVVYMCGQKISDNNPNLTSGSADLFTIEPQLPEGLSLDPKTGVISGTPVTPSSKTQYEITASNDYGIVRATIELEVIDELQ